MMEDIENIGFHELFCKIMLFVGPVICKSGNSNLIREETSLLQYEEYCEVVLVLEY